MSLTDDMWKEVNAEAKKQSIAGVLLYGIDRLPLDQRPPRDLLLQWISLGQVIESQNKRLNNRVVELGNMLEDAGLPCCLLKGQGNGVLYEAGVKGSGRSRIGLLRQPGDIDVWINAEKDRVVDFIRNKCRDVRSSFKHLSFPVFEDAKVDVHLTPLKLHNPRYQKRLKRWIDSEIDEQFANRIQLLGTEQRICVPTGKFNAVYQLGHMLTHFFDEGVGLRQIIDYYFVLLYGYKEGSIPANQKDITETINKVGMATFAKGIMWIENKMLGLPEERCLIEQNEKWGIKILEDILDGGNFGKYSERYNGGQGFFFRGIVEAQRVIRFRWVFPEEAMVRLVSKMCTAIKMAWSRFVGAW